MTSSVRYSKVAIGLHWLIALMIIGLIIFGKLMTNPETPNRFVLYQLHKSFGILVLLFSVLRLGWRLTHKPPPLPDGYDLMGTRGGKIYAYSLLCDYDWDAALRLGDGLSFPNSYSNTDI